MRNTLLFVLAWHAFACNQPVSESKLPATLAGVYTLQAVSNRGNNRDSSIVAENPVKIYTDKHYIYGAPLPDSTALLGFGSYVFTDSAIIEKNIFTSTSLDSAFETKFRIKRSPSSFTQIQSEPYDNGITFKKMPAAKASDLDGAWEQVSFVNITGADTAVIKNKQYKVYQDGYFMWIHRYPSTSTNRKFQTGYGFGIFSIKDNTVTETITSSNYKEIIEVPITVSFRLNSNDQLVLVFSDGNSFTTETYRRMN